MIRRESSLASCLALCCLSLPLYLTAQSPVLINEFMARNSQTLADADGDYSDWIELRNVSTADVNLDGWFLTDADSNLTKWRMPATTLPAGGYLVVFASGKDRATVGAELHTNFALDGGGEYLALVEPDGVTIANEFAPAYPDQFSDMSYGNGEQVESTILIRSGDTARYLVPADATSEENWYLAAFNDSTWAAGSTGLGFDANGSGSPSGLFAYWPIEEGAGGVTANLVSGGAPGAISGAVWVNNDPVRGTVLSFDGAGSYVSAGSIPALSQGGSDFSWSFWHYQRSVPNINAVVLGNREGGTPSPLQFVKFTPTNFEYYRDGHIGMVSYPIPSGQWLHLAVVKAGGTVDLLRGWRGGGRVGGRRRHGFESILLGRGSRGAGRVCGRIDRRHLALDRGVDGRADRAAGQWGLAAGPRGALGVGGHGSRRRHAGRERQRLRARALSNR